MTLGRKLLLAFSLVILALIIPTYFLTLALADNNFRRYIYQGDHAKAETFAPLLTGYWQRAGSWEGLENFLTLPPFTLCLTPETSPSGPWPTAAFFKNQVQERIVVLNARHQVIVDTSRRLVGTWHPAQHLVSAVELRSQGSLLGFLLVGTMVEPSLTPAHEEFLGALALALGFSMLTAALAAWILAAVLSRAISRPLLELTDLSRRIADGERVKPISVKPGSDLAPLQTSFNRMAVALSQGEERKARLLADAAHELRTPVSVIQGTLEAVMDGVFPPTREVLEPVYRETLRLSRLIASLRTLEELHEGGGFRGTAAVDLRDLLRTQTALVEPILKNRGIVWEWNLAETPLVVQGNAEKLSQVFSNLFSNALRYTPDGGRIALSASRTDDDQAGISWEDSGPGIMPQEREKVFERFYRVDASRSAETGGRGLGLTISREIILAHSGRIGITASRWGGVKAVVTLPLLPPSPDDSRIGSQGPTVP